MMSKPPYLPPPEAFAYLPIDYFNLPPEERARALHVAGRKMADDIFKQQFAATAEETHRQ